MVMLQSFPVNFSQSVSGASHPRSFCRQKQSSARPLQFARRIIKIKSAKSPVATRPTGYKKSLQINTHRLFFLLTCLCLSLRLSSRVSSCRSSSRVSMSSSAVFNCSVSHLSSRIAVFCTCIFSFVTARSERNSCESYEHEN